MEPVARVTVTVTFLRMDRAPAASSPGLPTDYQVVVVQSPTVAFYRYLYDTVGAGYVWWLRRTMPDDELAMLLVHGVLHLCGYDHERNQREAARMSRRERALFHRISPVPRIVNFRTERRTRGR